MEERSVSPTEPDVLSAAADQLAVERRRIEDELAAFAAFEEAVRALEPTPGDDRSPAVIGSGAVSQQAGGLVAVKSAYERTVMDVPHYEADYGDTYEESLVEEFGPDVAAAVVGCSSFTPQHQSILLSAAAEARSGREAMGRLVDDERTAVERAREELGTLRDDLAAVADGGVSDASFETLESARERLLDLEIRCEAGVDRRQETIGQLRRRTLSPVEATDYREFCYEGLAVEYPVLSAYADVLDRIRVRRREVERKMAYADE
jgi:hypothetical protein